MKPHKVALIAITLFLVAGRAYAGWEKAAVAVDGSEFYVDPSTIEYQPSGVIRVMEKNVSSDHEMTALIEYNCAQESFRPVTVRKSYSGTDEVESYFNAGESVWMCPVKESVAYERLKSICNGFFSKDKK